MKKNKNIVEIFKKYKTYILCIVIILLSIISIVIQYIDKNNSMKVNSIEIEKKSDKIAVYINGAVKNPGVYYLEPNSRLYELLDLCGGTNENADIEKVNLAKKLVDSDMITILEKQEKNYDEDYEEETYLDENVTEKININTASKDELMTLNGIGEQTANKIIEYRKTTRFNDIEDLMNVNGIGNSKYESIKEYICVD
jgi:competence protein ComEA